MNPFDLSKKYRKSFLEGNFLRNFPKKKFEGKGILYVFPTRFCSVGCEFCFLRSKPKNQENNNKNNYSVDGIQKVVNFANQVNIGHTVISGGGEPFQEFDCIKYILRYIHSERIVIATSGYWASSKSLIHHYITTIVSTLKQRERKTTCVIRLSVSEFHSRTLGIKHILQLIKYFQENLQNDTHLELQIHTFIDDNQLDKVLAHLTGSSIQMIGNNISDNPILKKNMPIQKKITLSSGYSFIVGFTKVINANASVNFHDIHSWSLSCADVYDFDLKVSEDDNPTNVVNFNRTTGINWEASYNGNITTWQNQVPDHMHNLYQDDSSSILDKIMNDPIMLSVLEKGFYYREKIVREVEPELAMKPKAIGIRDFAGQILFETPKMRLYYMIRVLQDWHHEERLTRAMLDLWPKEFVQLVQMSLTELQRNYFESDQNIFSLYTEKEFFCEKEWMNLFKLIKLGHYRLSDKELRDGINVFNSKCQENLKLNSLGEIAIQGAEDLLQAVIDRFSYQKNKSSI